MSARRVPASTVVSVFLTVAVSLLGFRLFLPGAAMACAPAEADCCCATEAPDGPAPDSGGCDCSVSPATPVPAAVLATVDGVTPPAPVAETMDAAEGESRPETERGTFPTPRARSAPTQALLETFRI